MEPRLIIFCLAIGMRDLAMYIPLDFLPDAMVREHDISHNMAGNIIAFYGFSSIMGRLISGIATNYLKNSAVLLTSISLLLLGGCCVGMAFSNLYWQFVLCAFLYGLFLGSTNMLLPISLIDMFGLESLKVSYGITMFFCASTTVFGPPMVGWFKVLWGTYYFTFIITAGLYFVGGILAFIALFVPNRNVNTTEYTNLNNNTK